MNSSKTMKNIVNESLLEAKIHRMKYCLDPKYALPIKSKEEFIEQVKVYNLSKYFSENDINEIWDKKDKENKERIKENNQKQKEKKEMLKEQFKQENKLKKEKKMVAKKDNESKKIKPLVFTEGTTFEQKKELVINTLKEVYPELEQKNEEVQIGKVMISFKQTKPHDATKPVGFRLDIFGPTKHEYYGDYSGKIGMTGIIKLITEQNA